MAQNTPKSVVEVAYMQRKAQIAALVLRTTQEIDKVTAEIIEDTRKLNEIRGKIETPDQNHHTVSDLNIELSVLQQNITFKKKLILDFEKDVYEANNIIVRMNPTKDALTTEISRLQEKVLPLLEDVIETERRPIRELLIKGIRPPVSHLNTLNKLVPMLNKIQENITLYNTLLLRAKGGYKPRNKKRKTRKRRRRY